MQAAEELDEAASSAAACGVMAAGVESKRRPAESLEELAALFAESGAEGVAGLSREANSERAVTGTGAAKVGALTPMTRLKPRGGFSCLPLS